MKKQIRFTCLIFLLLSVSIVGNLSAQTTIPGGYVSGTWTAAGSPYLIQGNSTVHADSSLSIEAGVEVIFQGHYTFLINGNLHANGTETDTIYFMPADTTTRWDGIEFHNSTSSLAYSKISYTSGGFGAMYFNNSTVDLSHCTINENTAVGSAGLDIELGSKVTVSHCSIIRNSSVGYGGGIGLWHNSFLSISNSEISFNKNFLSGSATIGGGIWSGSSDSLLVDNCIISHNTVGSRTSGTDSYGGAIGMETGNGFVKITNSTFVDNYAERYGGALYLENCRPILYGNNFVSNLSYEGAAIYLKDCNANLANNIFQKNRRNEVGGWCNGVVFMGDSSFAKIDHCNFYANGGSGFGDPILYISSTASGIIKNSIFSDHPLGTHIWFEAGGNTQVEYNNFYNAMHQFFGSVPAGLETISGINANGTPCDTFYNIYMDPLYVDPENDDFHLTEYSPSIDAGDPASPKDPDSTVADIGAFYYEQMFPAIFINEDSLNFGDVEIGTQTDNAFKIFNSGSDTLFIDQISSGLSVFTTNFDPANNFILPNDSMEITVSFIPDEAGSVNDTLAIDNNAQPTQLFLSGVGTPATAINGNLSLPEKYFLYPAYPNPFSGSTTIRFDLPEAADVELTVYDATGRVVARLLDQHFPAGSFKVEWNAKNVLNGVYYCNMKTGGAKQIRKLLLVR